MEQSNAPHSQLYYAKTALTGEKQKSQRKLKESMSSDLIRPHRQFNQKLFINSKLQNSDYSSGRLFKFPP